MNNLDSKTIAFFPHCDTFETFFDTINVSFDFFCTTVNNGWLFSYIEAIKSHQPYTKFILIFFSDKIKETVRRKHEPSGAIVYLIPTPAIYKLLNLAKNKLPKSKPVVRNTNNTTVSMESNDSSSLRKSFRSIMNFTTHNVFELEKILFRNSVEAIVVQEYESLRFDLCVWLGRKMNIPVYATYQGGNHTLNKWEKPFRRASIKNAAGLIIGPQSECNRVRLEYNKQQPRIGHIFNAAQVDTWIAKDKNLCRQLINIPEDAFVIVWHGRVLMHHKGLETLLKVWQNVQSPNRYLILVGNGSDDYVLNDTIKNLNLFNIERYNFTVDRDSLIRYLSCGDLYLFTSRHEGFAVAPIEAISLNIPVVSTNVPGARDTFPTKECGGMVYPIDDVEELTAGVKQLIEYPEFRTNVAKNARQHAIDTFSPAVIGKQLYNFIFKGE